MAQGNSVQAALAMEAHLQKNPTDGLGWRVLGKLY